MILMSGLRLRSSMSSVGPSISGITTAALLAQFLQRLDAVAGLDHGIAARLEPAGIERAQPLLVLDQEDRAVTGQVGIGGAHHLVGGGDGASDRRRRSLWQWRRQNVVGLGDVARQEDAEDRALADPR